MVEAANLRDVFCAVPEFNHWAIVNVTVAILFASLSLPVSV